MKKTIKKKSPSKKAKTKTKKTKPTKTARDKKIEEQQPWLTDEEFPIEYRNQFPEEIQAIDNYIAWLKENATKYEVELKTTKELDMFQSYRYGWAVGWSEGVEKVLERIKEVRNDTKTEENSKAEENRNKVNKFLSDKLNQSIEQGDPLYTSSDDAQFKVEDDNEEINNRFNEWWRTTQDPEYKSEYKSMTFDDLDKYECITFGAYLKYIVRGF